MTIVRCRFFEGTNEGQPPVNFYFDNAGLLVRLLRWNDTAVGPVATQYDYSDYRDVGGIRRPFRWVRTSTINQVTDRVEGDAAERRHRRGEVRKAHDHAPHQVATSQTKGPLPTMRSEPP